mmetsp:Transcript_28909/g.63754  ORF Transcript_28909/g.63754 Transcript_28909/m.63754 type:complete len:212 (-) Transcript_28909:590-1225(-)
MAVVQAVRVIQSSAAAARFRWCLMRCCCCSRCLLAAGLQQLLQAGDNDRDGGGPAVVLLQLSRLFRHFLHHRPLPVLDVAQPSALQLQQALHLRQLLLLLGDCRAAQPPGQGRRLLLLNLLLQAHQARLIHPQLHIEHLQRLVRHGAVTLQQVRLAARQHQLPLHCAQHHSIRQRVHITTRSSHRPSTPSCSSQACSTLCTRSIHIPRRSL